MSRWKTMVTLFSVCLLILVLSPIARADEWNKATILTFSEPVEIPGRVLPAGTYQFKLFDSTSNRNIVQVFDGMECICTRPSWRFQAIGPSLPMIP